jgi:cobalamin biosynthesis protein CobD/CbiB
MEENKKKTKIIIGVLILVIVVLLFFVIYAFLVKPAITGRIIQAQNQGVTYAISSIVELASQCQPVPLPFENQTINLVSIECLQQDQPE